MFRYCFIIFVVTGVPLNKRRANGVYAKIGVHPVKGWVFLEATGQTAFYADVGYFLQACHTADLDMEREALTRCANTRIQIFSCCMPCPNNSVGNN